MAGRGATGPGEGEGSGGSPADPRASAHPRLGPDAFAAAPGERPAERSVRFDPDRPFLFEGLAPRYATRRVRSVFVPMRDGVRLSTDFHVPLDAPGPLPVVLVRTPYGKNQPPTAMPALLPEQGIVYAIQDVRGRYESEGVFTACGGGDRPDGWDTLDWIAHQPWCNGRIGMLGSSYTGETAAKAAAMRHPAHRCGVIMFDGAYGGGATRNGAYLQGGATLLRMMFGWFRDWVPKVSFGPPAGVDHEAWFSSPFADAYESQPVRQPPVPEGHLLTLPVWSLLDRTGAAPSDFAEQMRRSADPCNPFFAAQGFLTEADRFDTPTLFVTGPLERGGSAFDNFRLFRANGTSDEVRHSQHLWFTPAVHSGYAACEAHTRFGARDFGDTRLPYYAHLLAWFRRWLCDAPLDARDWPAVRYFLAGRNVWREAADWPPPGAHEHVLHIAPDGRLAGEAPGAAGSDGFTYDPADPTPSEPPGTPVDLLGGGYADRAAIEARPDVLTYTTAPLPAPLALCGPVRAVLHLSTSTPDTDVAAVLSEVDADGRSVNITHGLARLRYRQGLDRPRPVAPSEVCRVEVDLWHAAVEVAAGRRLRLALSGSHFPVFDRNLNTGGDPYTETTWRVAHTRVHHGAERGSTLRLTVLEPDA